MSKSGKRYTDKFCIGNEEIELVQSFIYLRVKFTASGSFTLAEKDLTQKALKATFLLKRSTFILGP